MANGRDPLGIYRGAREWWQQPPQRWNPLGLLPLSGQRYDWGLGRSFGGGIGIDPRASGRVTPQRPMPFAPSLEPGRGWQPPYPRTRPYPEEYYEDPGMVAETEEERRIRLERTNVLRLQRGEAAVGEAAAYERYFGDIFKQGLAEREGAQKERALKEQWRYAQMGYQGRQGIPEQFESTFRGAEQWGLDTSELIYQLGKQGEEDDDTLKEKHKLDKQIWQKVFEQRKTESQMLSVDYPKWYERYATEPARRKAMAGVVGTQERADVGGFGAWAKDQPEFQKEIQGRETEMLGDYPTLYPAWQEWRLGQFQAPYFGGTPKTGWGPQDVKGFEEWRETTPVAKAYLESRKPQPKLGVRQAPRWATARQRV